jgi:hypothetical protein
MEGHDSTFKAFNFLDSKATADQQHHIIIMSS